MLPLIPLDYQLIMYDTLSQGSSSDHASTTAQQGSTGTRSSLNGSSNGQPSHRVDQCDERKEDRMKHDLLGIGSQFESKK